MNKKLKSLQKYVVVLLTTLLMSFLVVPASNSSSSVIYDFNTPGQLADEFNSYVNSGTVSQTTTGGISNSGAINAPGSANAIFASKDQYSLGNEGSVLKFSSYLKSVFNSGYSGMGFTSLTPSATNASTSQSYAPNDALGVSVHGGGFILHNGGTTYSGSWNSDNTGITTIKKSSTFDLLNNGSPDDWYKLVVEVTREAGDTFKIRVEVWPSDSDGDLLNPSEADAIFEKGNLSNSTILNAPAASSYINFSGSRVEYFDDYQVDLQGSTVVAAGSPVVLTSSASVASGVISATGNVTSDGGAAITERGFVLGQSSSPTLSDTKIAVAGTTGSYSGDSSSLSAGTYYLRAFATNSTGTTYGEEKTLTVTGPPSYNIIFDANEGSGTMAQQSSSSPQAITANGFNRDGFNFAGWNTEPDGSGTAYADEATFPFSANTTLYAQWEAIQSSPVPYSGPLIKGIGDGSGGVVTVSPLEQVTVRGERLGTVSEAFIDGKASEVISTSDDKIVIVIPEGLEQGLFDLVIHSSLGKLTFLDGIRVTAASEVTASYGEAEGWTKRISDTQVKTYIKFPTLGEKVRIGHQSGEDGSYETVFVKTIESEDDPSLTVNENGSYIVRTIDLEDINRIRVTVGDEPLVQVRYNK